MNNHNGGYISNCPYFGRAQKQSAGSGRSNRYWWSNQLKLNILRQNTVVSNPMGSSFNYAKEFKNLDLGAIKKYI